MTAAQTAPAPTAAPQARGAGVHLHHLRVQYGAARVLHDLTLHIAPGERVALIGASGGGKTTLLRALAGLTPHSGEVRVQAAGDSPARVRVMFQEDRLLPWLGALENAALGLTRAEREHASAALRGVGLQGREQAYPHELSGGQRQRVALARALAHRPDLLLLDEPFGALDALTRASMHDLLDHLLSETGATTLLVTHDLDEALKLADRVLLLSGGQVREDLPVRAPRPRRRTELEELRSHLEARLH
ncbi:ATP-binding cassette domain-containing protein (plasmid) [Deinococcus taeanensis]|uniref:ABC transporter ATP-binding protein n=1 Tax=Deinococcus taeanensis TaxID=2737050 RepID=UPI001CDB8A5C|nr:ATP-binding cassette domain-containing protein [Deinococcus taeanensis]UBV44930.1 ATP-binding cassette domain-containing protein [Deinococcus taeanensis]